MPRDPGVHLAYEGLEIRCLLRRELRHAALFEKAKHPLNNVFIFFHLMHVCRYAGQRRFRSSRTIRMERSEVRTPEILEACPSVTGRNFASFSRASALRAS